MLDHKGANKNKKGKNTPMNSANAKFVRGPYLHI